MMPSSAALPLISSPALHAVTMTGELSDVFGDRAEGVAYLVALMQRVAAGQTLRVYAGSSGFLDPEDAKSRTLEVASANWHATAALIARRLRRCAARRCGHHHDRPHPDQGRRGRRAWRHRRRAADRRRASLYRRGAHAGDGGSPQRTLQGSRAAHRGRALRHHGRCLAAHRRSSRRRRPLSQPQTSAERADPRARRGSPACLGATQARQSLASGWRSPAISQTASLPRSSMLPAVSPSDDALPRAAPVVGAGCGRFVAKASG